MSLARCADCGARCESGAQRTCAQCGALLCAACAARQGNLCAACALEDERLVPD